VRTTALRTPLVDAVRGPQGVVFAADEKNTPDANPTQPTAFHRNLPEARNEAEAVSARMVVSETHQHASLPAKNAEPPLRHDSGANARSTLQGAQAVAIAAPPSAEDARALARADALIRQGDIKGARLVLERALQPGSPHAFFALAETYDPRMLSSWKTYGVRPDSAKARELYGQAYAGGIHQARGRADALRELP
jgi:hypothetical protein